MQLEVVIGKIMKSSPRCPPHTPTSHDVVNNNMEITEKQPVVRIFGVCIDNPVTQGMRKLINKLTYGLLWTVSYGGFASCYCVIRMEN